MRILPVRHSDITISCPSNEDDAAWRTILDHWGNVQPGVHGPYRLQVSQIDRKFGTVYCSSGLGQPMEYHMDWALVSLAASRFPDMGSLTNVRSPPSPIPRKRASPIK